MKKITLALALCSVVLGMASCTRGGNVDRGNGGYIGRRGDRNDETIYDTDTNADNGDRRGDLGEDIYNIPHDVRRGIDDAGDALRDGIDDAGDDIRNGLDNAEWNLRHGMNRGGSTPDNSTVIR